MHSSQHTNLRLRTSYVLCHPRCLACCTPFELRSACLGNPWQHHGRPRRIAESMEASERRDDLDALRLGPNRVMRICAHGNLPWASSARQTAGMR